MKACLTLICYHTRARRISRDSVCVRHYVGGLPLWSYRQPVLDLRFFFIKDTCSCVWFSELTVRGSLLSSNILFRVQRTRGRPSRDAYTDGRVFNCVGFSSFCITRPTKRGPDRIFKVPCTRAPTPLGTRLYDKTSCPFREIGSLYFWLPSEPTYGYEYGRCTIRGS